MKRNITQKLSKRKKNIAKRLEKRNWSERKKPMMAGRNICYEIDGRHQGTAHGGIGNIHQLAMHSGLIKEIDHRMKLLKRNLPYHDSDHILNIAYNLLAGGTCLQDIELLRNDIAWLDALGAKIIPDPTTAGDFLRRLLKTKSPSSWKSRRFVAASGKNSPNRFEKRPSSMPMGPSVLPMVSAKRVWIFPMTASGVTIGYLPCQYP